MNNASKKLNKLVQGRLGLTLGPASDSSTSRFVSFSILDCFGLAKADFFGLSDPVVVVKWLGVERTGRSTSSLTRRR